jgi:hypothetical protein
VNPACERHGPIASAVQQMSAATRSAANASGKPPPDYDLPQRPQATSPRSQRSDQKAGFVREVHVHWGADSVAGAGLPNRQIG